MARHCENPECGLIMLPWMPRKRVDGKLICRNCIEGRPGRPRAQASRSEGDSSDALSPTTVEAILAIEDESERMERAHALVADLYAPKVATSASAHEVKHFNPLSDALKAEAEREASEQPCDHYEESDEPGACKNCWWARGAHDAKAGGPTGHGRDDFYKYAHDSGDGQTIYHCGEAATRYWTYDGIKTLGETVGTVQKVLVNTGGGGVWRDAMIHSFGEQRLWKVELRRNKQTKELFFTAEHRWLVRARRDPERTESRIVVTRDLQPGDVLSTLLPKSQIARTSPSVVGIQHGLVFGDGTRPRRGSARIDLWGNKNTNLLDYFGPARTEPIKTLAGVEGVRVLDQPRYFKDLPALSEDVPHLYGWLAGYFAADGCVSSTGSVVLHSARREHLEFAQLVATRLGIGTFDIGVQEREGFGKKSKLYKLPFIGSTLRANFFLVPEHRERWDKKFFGRKVIERLSWVVTSVDPTDRVEEVFCPRVPVHENFVLDSWINTMQCPFCGGGAVTGRPDGTVECDFCHQSFTVQVQPQIAAMPQTIDGQPQDMPGMPGSPGGSPAGAPGAPQDVANPPAAPGAAFVPPGQAPGASGAPGDAFVPPEKDEKKPSEKKASSLGTKRVLYIGPEGVVMNEKSYVHHLALRFADDRDTVLADIREANA